MWLLSYKLFQTFVFPFVFVFLLFLFRPWCLSSPGINERVHVTLWQSHINARGLIKPITQPACQAASHIKFPRLRLPWRSIGCSSSAARGIFKHVASGHVHSTLFLWLWFVIKSARPHNRLLPGSKACFFYCIMLWLKEPWNHPEQTPAIYGNSRDWLWIVAPFKDFIFAKEDELGAALAGKESNTLPLQVLCSPHDGSTWAQPRVGTGTWHRKAPKLNLTHLHLHPKICSVGDHWLFLNSLILNNFMLSRSNLISFVYIWTFIQKASLVLKKV